MKSEDAFVTNKQISPFARIVEEIFNFLCGKVTFRPPLYFIERLVLSFFLMSCNYLNPNLLKYWCDLWYWNNWLFLCYCMFIRYSILTHKEFTVNYFTSQYGVTNVASLPHYRKLSAIYHPIHSKKLSVPEKPTEKGFRVEKRFRSLGNH
jgi:hypothetical protein